ncbi:MAG TPA: hypothetical protein VHE83_17180 [Mycobacteriales bacterium]|nr:hypothetical protein [Mycobacteriales bacterium]
MGWDVLLRPVGPEPAAVYWRRRFAAISAVILVIVLFAYACGGGGGKHGPSGTGSHGSPSSSVSPSAAHATSRASTGSTGSTPACAPSDLTVSADMSASSYPDGAPPVIDVTVVDSGSAACTLDLGPAGIVAVITSGPARVWSNADCGTKTPDVVVLQPNQSKQTTITWNRFRSDPECKANVLATKADAGTYVVTSVTVLGKVAAFPNGGNVFLLK